MNERFREAVSEILRARGIAAMLEIQNRNPPRIGIPPRQTSSCFCIAANGAEESPRRAKQNSTADRRGERLEPRAGPGGQRRRG